MTVPTVTLFFALLALAAQAAVLAAAVLALGRRRSVRIRRWADLSLAAIGPEAVALAAGVALVATLGSLYLSEVANFVPCKLCWYQRIAMYPLVPLLALAAWRRDRLITVYALPLAALGGTISTYHIALERFPNLETSVCDPTAPCTVIWVERLGYLTIPTMALSGFALIAVLLLAARHAAPVPSFDPRASDDEQRSNDDDHQDAAHRSARNLLAAPATRPEAVPGRGHRRRRSRRAGFGGHRDRRDNGRRRGSRGGRDGAGPGRSCHGDEPPRFPRER